MQFSIKKWSKISTKTTNGQKSAFFDCARFGRIENNFGEMWEDFSHDDFDRELCGGTRIRAGESRWPVGANNYSPLRRHVICHDNFRPPPAHLTACDDESGCISVLPVPAPLTGCNDAIMGNDATMMCDDNAAAMAVRRTAGIGSTNTDVPIARFPTEG